jgi:integrase
LFELSSVDVAGHDLLVRAAAEALRHVKNPEAKATRRAYESAWAAWVTHCRKFAWQVLPIEPAHLVVYLQVLTETHAPNTVRLHLSALSQLDIGARATPSNTQPQSIRSHPIVARWYKGWSREHAKAPRKQAPIITGAELEHLLSVAAEPGYRQSRAAHAPRYARDRAAIVLGICAGLRVSELAELALGDVASNARGLTVTVRRSKANQDGKDDPRGVMPQGTLVRCPVDAWRAWLAVRGTEPGPAFVAIGRDGVLGTDHLDEGSLARAIQARARAAGLVLVTSHSMRATLATLATEKGKDMIAIANQGGWASLDVLRGYVRRGNLFVNNPTAGLLDD